MSLLDQALAETEVEISTTLLPTFTVQPFEGGDGPGWLTRLLKPRVRVRAGNAILADVAPAGDPTGSPLGVIVALVGAALVVVVAARYLR